MRYGWLFPANTRTSPNAVSMLAHRLRTWLNIETALGECLVFAGLITLTQRKQANIVVVKIKTCFTRTTFANKLHKNYLGGSFT